MGPKKRGGLGRKTTIALRWDQRNDNVTAQQTPPSQDDLEQPSTSRSASQSRQRTRLQTTLAVNKQIRSHSQSRPTAIEEESAEHREFRLEARRTQEQCARANDTTDQRNTRLDARRTREQSARASETPERRSTRLAGRRATQQNLIANDTPEERTQRLLPRRAAERNFIVDVINPIQNGEGPALVDLDRAQSRSTASSKRNSS